MNFYKTSVIAFVFFVFFNISYLSEPVFVDETGGDNAISLENLKDEIKSLDSQNRYVLAYDVLGNFLKNDSSLEAMQYAFEHARIHAELLGKNIKRKSISTFKEPEIKVSEIFENQKDPSPSNAQAPKKSLWEGVKDFYNSFSIGSAGYSAGSATGSSSVAVATTVFYIAGVAYNSLNEGLDAQAQKQDFHIATQKTALAILEQYDLLKDNVKDYSAMLNKNYPIGQPEEIKSKYLLLSDEADKLKRKIQEDRSLYVSYEVVSPNIAEANKQMYLATHKTLAFDDKKKILEAAFELTRAFHYDWLYQANEDVRLQYTAVIRAMKEEIGKAEWDDAMVTATFLDSDDPSKLRGGDSWWNK